MKILIIAALIFLMTGCGFVRYLANDEYVPGGQPDPQTQTDTEQENGE